MPSGARGYVVRAPVELFDVIQIAARGPEHIYYPKGGLQQDVPESVCRAAMIRTRAHKLIHRPLGVGELYDLTADSRELNNLHGRFEYGGVRRDLEHQLLDWYVRTSDVTPFDEDPRALPSVS